MIPDIVQATVPHRSVKIGFNRLGCIYRCSFVPKVDEHFMYNILHFLHFTDILPAIPAKVGIVIFIQFFKILFMKTGYVFIDGMH
jgi:hypothetical protein